jgi:carbonic anhydrase/acetyltransferase-like protein (isoleucine patch superfamily)
MTLYPFLDKWPRLDPTTFVAPNAAVIGDVVIGATVRGDVEPIRIGARTSIQDAAVVHATEGWQPTSIGSDVTVGHAAILHGCTVHDRVLVGMGALVMDAAVVESDVIVGAGSLVTPETRVPSGVLVLGRPAKPVRDLRPEELAQIRDSAVAYVEETRRYLAALGAGHDRR